MSACFNKYSFIRTPGSPILQYLADTYIAQSLSTMEGEGEGEKLICFKEFVDMTVEAWKLQNLQGKLAVQVQRRSAGNYALL